MTEYWPKPNSSMGAAVLVADKAILIRQSPLRLTHFLPWSFAGETSLVLPTTPVDSLLHNWPIEPSHYLRCGHYCCQWQLHSCQPPLHSFWSQLLPMATPFLSATSPLSGQLMAAPLSTSPVSCPIISSVDPNPTPSLLMFSGNGNRAHMALACPFIFAWANYYFHAGCCPAHLCLARFVTHAHIVYTSCVLSC